MYCKISTFFNTVYARTEWDSFIRPPNRPPMPNIMCHDEYAPLGAIVLSPWQAADARQASFNGVQSAAWMLLDVFFVLVRVRRPTLGALV